MIARYAASVVMSAGVTFGLLYLMQLMIDTGKEVITEPESVRLVDFVRVERNPVVETRERKPDRPVEPERQPDMPLPDMAGHFNAGLAVAVTAPNIESGAGIRNTFGTVIDGEYLPIVKVAPVYPARALARRLEGFVLVEFTVTASGAVRDVVVLESTATIFEKPAIEAALKFKYKPRVIDGAAVEVTGVRNRLVFTMANGEQLAMQ
jgi:protein TonB